MSKVRALWRLNASKLEPAEQEPSAELYLTAVETNLNTPY